MDYIVWIGHGEHDTQELPIRGARDPIEAAMVAATILIAENSVDWHIIDVLPVFPTAQGVH